MKIYSAYFNPQKDDEQLMLVSYDFYFILAILPSITLLTKKQYILAIAAFAITLFIGVMQNYAYGIGITLHLCYLLSCGWFGGDLYAYLLERDGYKLKDVICAKSEDEAELIYYSRARSYE